MKIKAFEVRHVQRMELRPFDRLGLGAGGPQRLAALAEAYAGAGPAFTILHGGEAAACGGVAVQPGATGNAWMLTSPLVERIPVAVARAVRGRLAAIEKDCVLTRIQTTVHARHDVPRAWFRFLGFACEGVLRKLVDDDDYYLYARVK